MNNNDKCLGIVVLLHVTVEAARVQVEKQLSDAKRAIRISSKRLEKSRRHAEYQILALTSKQAVLQNLEV